METTFVIIKPDAVARGLVGEITSRFERRGLQLLSCEMLFAEDDILREHYAHLSDQPYFKQILESMTAGPVVIQVWFGQSAVHVVRNMLGTTDPSKALPGTIRGDYGLHTGRNLCHASDSEQNAAIEIGLWLNTSRHGLCVRANPLAQLIYRS